MKKYEIPESEMVDLVHDATVMNAIRAYAPDEYGRALSRAMAEIYRDGRSLSEEIEEKISTYKFV